MYICSKNNNNKKNKKKHTLLFREKCEQSSAAGCPTAAPHQGPWGDAAAGGCRAPRLVPGCICSSHKAALFPALAFGPRRCKPRAVHPAAAAGCAQDPSLRWSLCLRWRGDLQWKWSGCYLNIPSKRAISANNSFQLGAEGTPQPQHFAAPFPSTSTFPQCCPTSLPHGHVLAVAAGRWHCPCPLRLLSPWEGARGAPGCVTHPAPGPLGTEGGMS